MRSTSVCLGSEWTWSLGSNPEVILAPGKATFSLQASLSENTCGSSWGPTWGWKDTKNLHLCCFFVFWVLKIKQMLEQFLNKILSVSSTCIHCPGLLCYSSCAPGELLLPWWTYLCCPGTLKSQRLCHPVWPFPGPWFRLLVSPESRWRKWSDHLSFLIPTCKATATTTKTSSKDLNSLDAPQIVSEEEFVDFFKKASENWSLVFGSYVGLGKAWSLPKGLRLWVSGLSPIFGQAGLYWLFFLNVDCLGHFKEKNHIKQNMALNCSDVHGGLSSRSFSRW